MQEANAQALHVVAHELTTTLNHARAALEASLERPGDPAPMTEIAELLRQSRGVLRVVEVYGGALLAEEMEHTARFLARGVDARQQAEGLDALMRAVVQLPAYLERVLGGGRDLALVLLPLLNDLRAVRGAPLLSEGTLLSLNLTSEQQPAPRTPAYDEPALTVPQWARRLRPRFQVALLGLIRGEPAGPHLEALADVAEKIEAAASTGPLFQLWWVAGAVIEGLRSDGIHDSASIKRLLGQADRELRRLYELGEESYSKSAPLDLLNNLLYYVARCTTDGPRVSAVRASFRLSELLPADETIEHEQESLSGPSIKLMHTVAAAIKEDLGRVKDALDLFTRKGGQPEELGPQVELLKKISDTLAVLGLGSLRERVLAELGRLSALVSRSAPADRDSLIGMAAALITVEDSLDDSLVQLIMPPGAPLAGVIQDPEFRQVAEAVLRECAVNLARIKDLIAQALEPSADVAGIDAVPTLARGVTAGLLMLGKTRAMEVMERTSRYIAGLLRPGIERPPARVMDRLADAVVSIEYYMETLQAGRGDAWYMLDNAERCLAAVDARIAPAAAAPAAAPVQAPEPPREPTVVLERPAELAAAQLAETVPTAAVAPPETAMPPAAAAATEAATLPVDALDAEMLDIFIEEAREELEVIGSLFPLWAENPVDRESLTRVRRAFHTLKGSGRMVGAMALGEFAWAIENLLNRVIEGTLDRSPNVMGVLRHAVATLPGLIDAVARRESLPPETAEFVERAQEVASGEAPRRRSVAAPVKQGYEPTMMVATLDEATMARMLARVPPLEARVLAGQRPAIESSEAALVQPPPEPEPAYTILLKPAAPVAEAEVAPAIPAAPVAEAQAVSATEPAPAAPPAEVEVVPATGLPPPPLPETLEAVSEAGPVPAPAFGPSPEFEQAFEAEPFAAMDPSLQDIFSKEVQVHLDVFRDFLRKAWVTPGPHHVTEELYRACHTLRGASRTAESHECIRLADPLHSWLRRLFDSDRAFADDALATLADAVAAFEDVVDEPAEGTGAPLSLDEVIARISALDLALEQSIAAQQAEPQAPPPVVEAPAEPKPVAVKEPTPEPLELEHLIPAIVIESAEPHGAPGAGFDRLLPPGADADRVPGEIPYFLGPAEVAPPSPPAEAAAEALAAAAPAGEARAAESGLAPLPPTTEELQLPSVIAEVARAEAWQPGPPPAETLAAPEAEAVAAPEAPAAMAPPPVAPAAPTQPPVEVATAADVDYDAEIAAIFSEEATELLEAADGALGALRAQQGSRERVVELQRVLHTIKGGARMAGIRAMGDLSHELESLLIQVGGGAVPLDERTFEVLQASLDELNRMRDFVNAGRGVNPVRDLITRIQLVARGATPEPVVEQPGEGAPAEPVPFLEEAVPETVAAAAPEVVTEESAEAAEAEARELEPVAAAAEQPAPVVLPGRETPADRAEMARVDADLLDAMLNNAGEVSIYRARLEQQLSSIDFNLAELSRVVQRLKDQLRKLEIETEAQILHRHVEQAPRRTDFDPLELDRYSAIQQYSRALGETASDVASIQGLLGNLTREAQNLLTQQGRIVSDLQDGLMRTRMVPFQRHAQRLTRIVRQAAAELGKRADLTVTGAAGELDRQVLDRMLPLLEHLVRNAVVHGIEPPAERLQRGKPETGHIELTLRREGSEVVITVADDGAGINLRVVREKAAALGIVPPKQELSDEQAMQLILEPGFTTAGRLTQSAGRGVGMDVVATEVKKLGGALFIDSEEGRGARFTVRLPFTLAISQALVVRAGEEFFALPLPTIEGVVRVPVAEVQRQLAGESAGFEYGGQLYRFQHLSSFVGNEPAPPAEREPAVPVILVRAGEHSTGIVTDELVGSREIVVKTVGPQISGIRGISGATILGDGRICIILDVGALVRSDWRVRAPPERVSRPRADERVFALVVDDSITVRRVTQRLLERNGMRVMTAKDGLDAIGILQDHVPDVILLDIEMPRMDGYEVASHVRNDPRLADVPIVMITSRVGEKHRARAIELGVNDYLGKPYQETQLLQALEPLLQRRRAS
jgi:chemosensory pili system protein ChpA (sensor histidine kinase/response regulator)